MRLSRKSRPLTDAADRAWRPLCRLSDIPDGQARGFLLEERPVLVARRGDRVFGYVNRCPHRGVGLDWAPDRFVSADGAHLQCATHGALFRFEDGLCVAGPCTGLALGPCAVRVADRRVWVREEGAA